MQRYFTTTCAICSVLLLPEKVCGKHYCAVCAVRQALIESTVRVLLEAAA